MLYYLMCSLIGATGLVALLREPFYPIKAWILSVLLAGSILLYGSASVWIMMG